MAFKDRLREARLNIGLDQNELAKEVGIGGSSISNYETGISFPKTDILYKLFDVLKVSPNFLFQDDVDIEDINNRKTVSNLNATEILLIKKYRELDQDGKEIINYLINKELFRQDISTIEIKNTIKLPLADFSLSAGLGTTLLDNTYEWIEIDGDKYPNADVAFRISGNSMEPKYHDSDIVYIHKQDTLEIGEIGAFLFNGEQYLKKFAYDNGMYRLRSLNPEYKDITIDNDSLIIYGKVIN